MSIAEVVLFVSSTSKNCRPCFEYLQEHRIPISVVRLDTAEQRAIALSGQYFSVKTVPALMIGTEEGQIQLYEGLDKIFPVLEMLKKAHSKPVAVATHIEEPEDEVEEIEEEESETPPPPPSKSKSKPKPKSKSESKPAPKPESKTKPKGKKDKKNRKTVVISEDEPEQIEIFEDTPEPTPTKSSKKTASKMTSLLERAKEMAAQREQSLGYSEKDLPRSVP